MQNSETWPPGPGEDREEWFRSAFEQYFGLVCSYFETWLFRSSSIFIETGCATRALNVEVDDSPLQERARS